MAITSYGMLRVSRLNIRHSKLMGLMVNVKITYYLNGKKMSAKDIAGRSG